MVIYNTGAPPFAEVIARLCSPDTDGLTATVLATVTTRADITGTWAFAGPWPAPNETTGAELLSQNEVNGMFGLPGTFWQIVEAQPAGAQPNVWTVLVTGTQGAYAQVTGLTTTTSLQLAGWPAGTPTVIYGGNV